MIGMSLDRIADICWRCLNRRVEDAHAFDNIAVWRFEKIESINICYGCPYILEMTLIADSCPNIEMTHHRRYGDVTSIGVVGFASQTLFFPPSEHGFRARRISDDVFVSSRVFDLTWHIFA